MSDIQEFMNSGILKELHSVYKVVIDLYTKTTNKYSQFIHSFNEIIKVNVFSKLYWNII